MNDAKDEIVASRFHVARNAIGGESFTAYVNRAEQGTGMGQEGYYRIEFDTRGQGFQRLEEIQQSVCFLPSPKPFGVPL